jgi:hypothetical protein
MNPFGKTTIYVLTITLLLASWVRAEVPCRSQGAGTMGNAAATQDVAASHHVEHAAPHGEAAIPDPTEQDTGLSTDDCPCCDDCATLCAGLGGSALASESVPSEPSYDVNARLLLSAANFRPQPPPQSLFRPPIS